MTFPLSAAGAWTLLLNDVLEASQPVLLAGEPGSGEATVCKGFLLFSRPHVSPPASPLLSSELLSAGELGSSEPLQRFSWLEEKAAKPAPSSGTFA